MYTYMQQLVPEVIHVSVLACAIDDHVGVAASIGDHSVINDAPLLIGDEREPAFAILEPCNVAHYALLKELHCIFACPPQLTHVRHIK